jgi:FkbM family methyltransferase
MTATSAIPSCTVVICTRDRPELLDRCLDAVTRLHYPRFSVLVVDNVPTTTESHDVAKRWSVDYVLEPIPGLSRARNHGARSTSTEIVAYLDDDAVPRRDWLTRLVAEFDNQRTMAVAGRILPLTADAAVEPPSRWTGSLDRGSVRRAVTLAHPLWFELANFGGIGSGGNMAFRRSAFEVWPGFDERLGRGAAIGCGEDDLAFFSLVELGYQVVYAPGAVVRHPDRPDVEKHWSQYMRDVTASAGYVTLLFVEKPRYRGRLLRYVVGWLRGAPRPWRRPGSWPSAVLPSRWRMTIARLAGITLYARCRLRSHRADAAGPGVRVPRAAGGRGPGRGPVRGLSRRAGDYLRASRMLARAGATLPSILLFPVRRRLTHPRSQIVLRSGASLVAPVDEPLLGLIQEIWVDRCYAVDEPDTASGGVIVDIGAHVGVFTAWAATQYKGLRVVALEPSSRMCAALRENVAASRLNDVTIVQAACGAGAGEAALYSRGAEGMNSLYQKDNYGSAFRALETVQVVTLDEVFRRFAIERCALLKLDCEGAEYDILFNAADVTLARVERIAMEYHVGLAPGSPEALRDFLDGRGFTVRYSPLADEEGGYLHAVRRR